MVARIGNLAALLIIWAVVAALVPVFAAGRVSGSPETSQGAPPLAVDQIGVAITDMQVDEGRTELRLEVSNLADEGYLMVRVECTLYDESGTAIASKDEFIWDLKAGATLYGRPTFTRPIKPKSAKCRAVEAQQWH